MKVSKFLMYNAIYLLGSFKKYFFYSKHVKNINLQCVISFLFSHFLVYLAVSAWDIHGCPCVPAHTRVLKCKHFRV